MYVSGGTINYTSYKGLLDYFLLRLYIILWLVDCDRFVTAMFFL